MGSESPLFSVVISTYNYGHLIERTVRSVLSQTFDDYELIVVDDGSTDDTEERLRQFGDRLRYIKKQNGGQSTAYNLGARQSRGQFIYILDADDELAPNALTIFARAIRAGDEHARAAVFYGGYVSVSDKGKEVERPSTDTPADRKAAVAAFLTKKTSGLKNGAFVIPRNAYDRLAYPEQLRNNTDIVFIGQALALFPTVNVGAIVLKSHEHPQRTRKQLDRILAAGIRPVEAMFDPQIMPADLMPLRKIYLAQRWRSIARLLYLHGLYADARYAYWLAFKAWPRVMLEWASVRRAIVSFFKGRGAAPTHLKDG